MNSDNCLLSGRTLDYGPFGFMEAYQRKYQPFTSDVMGNYCFVRQPLAAQTNAGTLAGALLAAITHGDERERCVEEMRKVVEEEFPVHFRLAHFENCRRKLGLATWDDEAQDMWNTLLELMEDSGADFTVFFRSLINVLPGGPGFDTISAAFAGPDAQADKASDRWKEWLQHFQARISKEARDPEERAREMRLASPKYVPRNWILFEAYDAAERGDYAPVLGILKMLTHPYEEQLEFESAYFRAAPDWARGGGLAFMS